MIFMVSMVLINGFLGGPTSMMGWICYMLCSMPFFIDMFISMHGSYERLTSSSSPTSSGATVEEISANEENFINQNRVGSSEE